MGRFEIGTRVFDSLNGRYIEVDSVGCDPNCYSCIQEEFNDDGDLEVTGRILLTRYDIEKIMRRN